MSLAAFESVAVATVMPVAAPDIGGLSQYSWAFTAYVASSLVGMVVCGALCDRGHLKSVTVAGVAAFCLGAVVAGLANAMAVLIIGRSVQGLAAGILVVAVYVMVARGFPEELRPRAFVLLSAAWVVPSIAGPAFAGWIATALSWRWVFLLVPVVVIGPALAMLPLLNRLSAVPDDAAASGAGSGWRRVRAAAGAAIGLALVQDGVIRLGLTGAAQIAGGLALLAALVPRLVPPGTFRLARGLPTTIALRGVLAGAYFGAEVFIPLALVEQRGLPISLAGAALSVAAVGWFAGSLAQSRLPSTVDRTRVAMVGAGLVALGLLLVPVVLLEAVPVWWIVIAVGVQSAGMGVTFPTIAVIMLRESAPDQQGFNSSALQFADSAMSVIAAALAGGVHAAAVQAGGATAQTYAAVWLGTAALAALGILVARRLGPVDQSLA